MKHVCMFALALQLHVQGLSHTHRIDDRSQNVNVKIKQAKLLTLIPLGPPGPEGPSLP